jgi:Putative addiction module component
MSIETVQQLSRSEKLKLMELLWEQLSRPDEALESPAWHAQELAETERRLAEGKEQVMDWEAAKKELRRRVEWKCGYSLRQSTPDVSFMTAREKDWEIIFSIPSLPT